MLTRSKAIVTKFVIPALAVTILVSAWSAVSYTPASRAYQATPAAPVVVASEVLGSAKPAAVDDAELALGRVTIMPGAAIPIHYHVGAQIGVVVQGELTYTVFSGATAWHRGDQPDAAPTIIEPGQTVVVLTGDALIESPGSVHQGRNDGDEPLVIFLSTLFPADAPRAVLVDATPTA